MKTSQLRQLIKEEITKSLSELEDTESSEVKSSEVKDIKHYFDTSGKTDLSNINTEDELLDVILDILQGMNPTMQTTGHITTVFNNLKSKLKTLQPSK